MIMSAVYGPPDVVAECITGYGLKMLCPETLRVADVGGACIGVTVCQCAEWSV